MTEVVGRAFSDPCPFHVKFPCSHTPELSPVPHSILPRGGVLRVVCEFVRKPEAHPTWPFSPASTALGGLLTEQMHLLVLLAPQEILWNGLDRSLGFSNIP